ncbi:MAG TPA: arginine--tRNA ligase [Candidatus Saccharimonadales bacterium]|nr:arginine--tRNA ligase [Candidatus Saccharimonadales bacterium]
MKTELDAAIEAAVKELFGVEVKVELTRPDEQFGDYATNVALRLASKLDKPPREIAETLAQHVKDRISHMKEVSVAGPGFLNITLIDEALLKLAESEPVQNYKGQQILVEFGDPNPLKAMHLGHLYTTVVGDAICRLFEVAGADVKRLSYHGDVGMHVAKAVWAIGEQISWDTDRLQDLEADEIRIDGQKLTIKTVIGYLYAKGAQAYEEEGHAAEQIRAINKSIYAKDQADVNKIYDWGVKRSFAYFDLVFKELSVNYDKRYLESESSPIGLESVQKHLGKVFEKSEGAIVYKGEKKGLHTRVFVNSEGLPTYEAKDLGLTELKKRDFPNAGKSIIITATEQTEYFRVMLAALSEFDAELAAKTVHMAHGFLSLTSGKMSSRTGKVHQAQELLDDTQEAVKQAYPDSKVQCEVYLAAVKYTFLKNRIGGDIVFDVQESVTLEGNSGPYLQYALARANSILKKSQIPNPKSQIDSLEPDERSLLRKLGEYAETVEKAVDELMPHHIAIYLYELAQKFNSFYEHNRVIGDAREEIRLSLVQKYADTLKNGLETLGVPAPESM